MKRVLLTGGAGFIGHHIAEHILNNSDAEIVFLDRLDVSGDLHRITQIKNWDLHKKRCTWLWHDLKAPLNEAHCAKAGRIDTILHVAASTHVDRSISDPLSFVFDNVVGTANLLEYARTADIDFQTFLYFSTDEVFGPAPFGVAYKEWDRYRSGNPYAATKAGAEELCLAYANTYKMPIFVTHTMNVFGERQHPEKFIPSTISKVMAGKKVTIHSNASRTVSGSRFYIYAPEVAEAIDFLLSRAEPGQKYNIVGELEVTNLELAQAIAEICGKPLRYEMVDFHSSRPGHDLRYALDGSLLRDMGWTPRLHFHTALERTVRWQLDLM